MNVQFNAIKEIMKQLKNDSFAALLVIDHK